MGYNGLRGSSKRTLLFGRMLRMAFLPQSARNYEGVNVLLLPPLLYLACGVDVVVVDRAEGDCEFVADL